MSELLQNINQTLQKGKMKELVEYTEAAINENYPAQDILNAMLEGMGELGVRFKNNEVFVPEVLIAARAMNAGLEKLKPLLASEGVEPIGKVVIGTVKGDLHDIGKNLVRMMLVGAGFEVIDLGVNVTPEKYLQAAKDNNADIVCMSALLTSTMNNMKLVIDALEQAGIRDQVTVMVGGAPITQQFAENIGADIYTPDASTAATRAKEAVS